MPLDLNLHSMWLRQWPFMLLVRVALTKRFNRSKSFWRSLMRLPASSNLILFRWVRIECCYFQVVLLCGSKVPNCGMMWSFLMIFRHRPFWSKVPNAALKMSCVKPDDIGFCKIHRFFSSLLIPRPITWLVVLVLFSPLFLLCFLYTLEFNKLLVQVSHFSSFFSLWWKLCAWSLLGVAPRR